MDRRKFHYSRHLVHYQDDLVDATCSLHCTALSLALNMDRGPKVIHVRTTERYRRAETWLVMLTRRSIWLV
ncbi:MAG: hypothetical protein R3F36_09770 [Candidatus Competibacteraceae bacterium]